MTRWRKRIYIIVTAPFEVIGCTIVSAWRGGAGGVENIRDAWRETR